MPDHIDEIRTKETAEFQDTILRSSSAHKFPYVIQIKNQEYVLFPRVFNPVYAKAAMLLLDNLGVQKGDYVLDPFTGSGVDGNFSVLEGASKAVLIDTFEMPCLCARYNALQLGIEDNVEVFQGDLFDPLKHLEHSTFDLIVANPPFKNSFAKTDLEKAVRDEGYQTLKRFWNEVGDYLKEDGRIRTVFSNVGDLDYFYALADQNHFKRKHIASCGYASQVEIHVHEFTR